MGIARRTFGILAAAVLAWAFAGCTPHQPTPTEPAPPSYEDGRYRGTYIDRDEVQVVVQFHLEDNRVTDIRFRQLTTSYAEGLGPEFLRAEEGTTEARLRDEMQKLIDHLVGKDIRAHLADLYSPEEIAGDADGLTAATLRSPKIISAVRDALNRGVYSY